MMNLTIMVDVYLNYKILTDCYQIITSQSPDSYLVQAVKPRFIKEYHI